MYRLGLDPGGGGGGGIPPPPPPIRLKFYIHTPLNPPFYSVILFYRGCDLQEPPPFLKFLDPKDYVSNRNRRVTSISGLDLEGGVMDVTPPLFENPGSCPACTNTKQVVVGVVQYDAVHFWWMEISCK